jgi:cytochrome c oxidase assembly factor CtaG
MNLPVAHLAGIFAPLELVPMLIAAALYARRATTLAARGRPVPLWRQLCFAAGLLCIAGALITPLSDLADELVIAHMIEHLLIGDIASLLIVLGLTGPLLQPILAIPIFDRLRVLCHPVVAMSVWAITIFAWHAPPLYDAAYGNSAAHFLEHAMFITVGVLLWMPVFGPLPNPPWFTAGWKVVYVIVMRLIATVLGNILMWDGQVLYDVYAKGEALHHIEPLTDQSIAGVVMMVEGIFLGLGVLAWFFFLAAKEGIEKQRLLDLAIDYGVDLDPARAQRAVAAGHGDHLEQQIIAGATKEPYAPPPPPGADGGPGVAAR